jgi:hypothetical protein
MRQQNFRVEKFMVADFSKPDRPKFKFTKVDEFIECPESPSGRGMGIHGTHLDEIQGGVSISGQHDTEIFVSSYVSQSPGAATRLTALTIRNCRNCRIISDVPLSHLNIYGVEDSRIVVLGVKGSIHLLHCKGSYIEGFCHQLRITDSSKLTIRVQTGSLTALANSTEVEVGKPPQPDSVSGCLDVLSTLNMATPSYLSAERWTNVKDFNCLHPNSPNWNLI